MKKAALVLSVGLLFATISSSMALAVKIPLRVVVNGEKVMFPDAEPFIDANSRVQVPIRFVSEALGANVGWIDSTKTVTVKLKDKEVVLPIGKKNFQVNGENMQMDTEALLKEERTFVPIRFVSEALGATVRWEDSIKTLKLRSL